MNNLNNKINKLSIFISYNLFLITSLLLILLLINLIRQLFQTKFNFYLTLIFCYFFSTNLFVNAAAPIYYYPKINNVCDYYAAIQKLNKHPECNKGKLFLIKKYLK